MAVICPQCNTENRDIAKFCIECVSALPTLFANLDFTTTDPGALRAGAWRTPLREKSTASHPQFLTPRAEAAAAAHAMRPAVAPARSSRTLRVSLATCMTALIAGAAGWMLAGLTNSHPNISATAAAVAPVASAAADTMPRAAAAPESARVPTEASMQANGVPSPATSPAPAPAARPVQSAIADAPSRSASSKERPATRARPNSTGGFSGPAPTADADGTAAVAQSGPTPSPVRLRAIAASASEPRSACSELSFFAAARCMAAQCAKPEFRPHPQCEAVRRQQRVDEEKRNPILSN